MSNDPLVRALRAARVGAAVFAAYWCVALGALLANLAFNDLFTLDVDAELVERELFDLVFLLLVFPGPTIAAAVLIACTQRVVVALEPARARPWLAAAAVLVPFWGLPFWLAAFDKAMDGVARAPRPARAAQIIGGAWGVIVAVFFVVVLIAAALDAPTEVGEVLFLALLLVFWLARVVAALRIRQACGDVLDAAVADAARVQHAEPVSGG